MSNKKKPEFKEVCEYAKKSIDFIIGKKAAHLPFEFKEEIKQEALLRAWTSYENLDPDKGWRSFIQLHCRGALKDYMKRGAGSLENSLDLERMEIKDDEGNDLSAENVLGLMGHFHLQNLKVEHFKPNWELLAKLIVKDEDLHIVCKVLIGLSQEEIAEQLVTDKRKNVSRERVSQRWYEFFDRLDAVTNINDPMTDQVIFALGLSKYYFMPEKDNGLGWDLAEFNIYDPDSFRLVEANLRLQEKLDEKQMSFEGM